MVELYNKNVVELYNKNVVELYNKNVVELYKIGVLCVLIGSFSGSLGQGLSVGAGMAYTAKYLEHASYRTYCLIGDGESAEVPEYTLN